MKTASPLFQLGAGITMGKGMMKASNAMFRWNTWTYVGIDGKICKYDTR
jgi:hypothetical protein